MKKILILSSCLLATCSAFSFAPNTFPASTVGNVTTFGSGVVGGGNLGSASFGFASDGTVTARGPVTFNGAGVARVTGEIASTVPKLSVARAIGNFAFRVVPVAALAVGLYQLYQELGFGVNSQGKVTRPVSTAPGMWANDYSPFIYASKIAACDAIWQAVSTRSLVGIMMVPGYNGERCVVKENDGSGVIYYSNLMFQASGPAVITQETATQQQLEDAIAAKSGWPSNTSLPLALRESLIGGEVVPVQAPIVTGPATSPGERTTVTNPDGSSTVTNTTNNYTYEGNKVTVTTTTIIQNFSPTGSPVGSPTTTTSQPVLNPIPGQNIPVPSPTVATPPPAPTPPASAPITCGLPGTPPCKIDETGTKTGAETTYDSSKTAIDTAKTSAETNIGSAASIGAPSWSFAFQLPTGCAPYVTGIKGVVLNVCQYQSTIHGLLSLIWAAATAFGLIGMVGRTIREA